MRKTKKNHQSSPDPYEALIKSNNFLNENNKSS